MTKVFTLKKLVSQFKAYLTTCAIPSKTFIWLPFMGGISAFAVILPKPARVQMSKRASYRYLTSFRLAGSGVRADRSDEPIYRSQ
jgi:hypothetical protein